MEEGDVQMILAPSVITITKEIAAYAYQKAGIFKNFTFYKQLVIKCITELVFNERSFLPHLWHFSCCPGGLSELSFFYFCC